MSVACRRSGIIKLTENKNDIFIIQIDVHNVRVISKPSRYHWFVFKLNVIFATIKRSLVVTKIIIKR